MLNFSYKIIYFFIKCFEMVREFHIFFIKMFNFSKI